MKYLKLIDVFFVIMGLLLVFVTGQEDKIGGATRFMIAFGGAILGAALAHFSLRLKK